MNIVVAANQKWGIGRENDLLARIPADIKRFAKLTSRKIVVMGRRTWESLPEPPLKNRTNIVLSTDKMFSPEGAIVCRSLDELMEKLKEFPPENIFIIGGESVYRQLLPYCQKAYVTRFVSPKTVKADKFFPDIDEMPDWYIVTETEEKESNDILYRYVLYKR